MGEANNMKKRWITVFIVLFIGSILSAQTLDERIKSAVDGLSQFTRIEVVIYPPVIQGTDTPSELSRYLYQKIDTYAVSGGRFNVRQPTRGGPQGRIEGSYLQTGDKITVTLKLISDGGIGIAAKEFTISTAELNKMHLAWLPANVKTQEEVREREELFDPPVPPVNNPAAKTDPPAFTIAAWPNSASHTYYDGEELSVTVWTDRDCYFKVYHIDVNNEVQLIYPSSVDRESRPNGWNNFLRANTQINVPNPSKAHFILHDPYGQETILVVASLRQFDDIETEILQAASGPGVRATRSALSGITRGGSLVSVNRPPADNQTLSTRFTFNILSPGIPIR
jgi:hypothetical protein